jgi:hypothetical protein
MKKPRFQDDDGNWVCAGDRVKFVYGIPFVKVVGKVVNQNGQLRVLTPGHNPSSCPLRSLRYHVGAWWKEEA